METVIAFCVVVGLTFCSILLYAWVLQYLWLWLVVPSFMVDPLSFQACVAATMVVALMKAKGNRTTDTRDSKQTLIDAFSHAFVLPITALAFGYIFKLVLF